MKISPSSLATTTLAASLAIIGATFSQADRSSSIEQNPDTDSLQLAELQQAFGGALDASIPWSPDSDPELRRARIAGFLDENRDALKMIGELHRELLPRRRAESIARARERLEIENTTTQGERSAAQQLAQGHLELEEDLPFSTPPSQRREAVASFLHQNRLLLSQIETEHDTERRARFENSLTDLRIRFASPPPSGLTPAEEAQFIVINQFESLLHAARPAFSPDAEPTTASMRSARASTAALIHEYSPQLEFLKQEIENEKQTKTE